MTRLLQNIQTDFPIPVQGNADSATWGKREPSQDLSVTISETPPLTVNDKQFYLAAKFLQRVQQSILRETDLPPTDIRIGRYRSIRFRRFRARQPTIEDWEDLEDKIIKLEPMLSKAMLKRVELKHISGAMLTKWGLFLLFLAIGALAIGITSSTVASSYSPIGVDPPVNDLPSVSFLKVASSIAWSGATGALGSVAFILVNALAIQVDPNVDFTSRTLVRLRMILGALFAIMVPLAFGLHHFDRFNTSTPPNPQDSCLILLPFVLGFSTPLALTILGRLIEVITSLFRLGGTSTDVTRNAPPPTSRRIKNAKAVVLPGHSP